MDYMEQSSCNSDNLVAHRNAITVTFKHWSITPLAGYKIRVITFIFPATCQAPLLPAHHEWGNTKSNIIHQPQKTKGFHALKLLNQLSCPLELKEIQHSNITTPTLLSLSLSLTNQSSSHGLLGTAHMCICKHAGCHAPKTTTHPHKQQKKKVCCLLFVGVGGCFRGMAACMLANTHVGCPQGALVHYIIIYHSILWIEEEWV